MQGGKAFAVIGVILATIGVLTLGAVALMGCSHEAHVEDVPSVAGQVIVDEGDDAPPSGGEATAATTPPEPSAPKTVTISMIGDVLMHDQVVESGAVGDGSYDYSFLFEHVLPLVSDTDVRILNQETVMGLPGNGYSLTMRNGNPTMNTPLALADAEVAAGFNVILKATNHTYDQGYDGLAHELGHWGAAYPQIPVLGVDNPDAPDGPQDWVDNVYVLDKDGFRVAILNHTWATNQSVDPDTDARYVSIMTEEKVRADVAKARALGADAIVACPHWGVEYRTDSSDEEMTFSKLYADLGVDVILGCHPHILQHVETLRNAEGHETICYYSLGNYVASVMPDDSLIGGVARLTLEKTADGKVSVTQAALVPTVVHKSWGRDMAAFPVASYSDDLAAGSERPGLTREYANDFCSSVFGSGYDAGAGMYVHDMHAGARQV